MQIFVRTISGRTITVNTERNDTVLVVKQKIEDKEGIPAGDMQIVYGGKNLEDHKTLSDYDIQVQSYNEINCFVDKLMINCCLLLQKESTLHIVIRVIGGQKKLY